MQVTKAVAALAALSGTILLAGCGGNSTPAPAPSTPSTPSPSSRTSSSPLSTTVASTTTERPTTTTTFTTTPAPTYTPPPLQPFPDVPTQGDWKLHPIKVDGQHLYDAVTKDPFWMVGICFPVLPDGLIDDVQEWIKVLERIKHMGPSINVIRVYILPKCATDEGSTCMEPFMRKADDLGVYVLVPGTGTDWGYLPIDPTQFDDDINKAYKMGSVLGFGQRIIQNFNYPNTLAVVIGNEFDQQPQVRKFLGLIKAYARDLKSYMSMCNTDSESPTKGDLREIPLAYACSDDSGDEGVIPKADLLMCDSARVSVDMFGQNIERWCEDATGAQQYKQVNDKVAEKLYPGAYFFSEMGCSKLPWPEQTRSWTQVTSFFNDFPAFSGYAAYAYNGNPDFDMFTGPNSTSSILPDGTNFFNKLKHQARTPKPDEQTGNVPECPTSILGTDLIDFRTVQWYDTGSTGYAAQCPKPYGAPLERWVV